MLTAPAELRKFRTMHVFGLDASLFGQLADRCNPRVRFVFSLFRDVQVQLLEVSALGFQSCEDWICPV